MAEFAYNNTKNVSISHTLFELNYGYYLWLSYEKNIDFRSKSRPVDKLLVEL